MPAKIVLILLLTLCAGCVIARTSTPVAGDTPTYPSGVTPTVKLISTTTPTISQIATSTATRTPTPLISAASATPQPSSTDIVTRSAFAEICEAPPVGLDSMTIAFAAEFDGDLDIYTIQADGRNLRQLTNNNGIDAGPSWSPDGRYLAFISGSSIETFGLYVVSADGAKQARLAPEISATASIVWSSDSRKIAFWGWNELQSDIYIVDMANKSVLNLTKQWLMGVGSISWSPDNVSIAFDAAIDSFGVTKRVHTIKSDGSSLRELESNSEAISESKPQWHPVKQLLLFIQEWPGADQLCLMMPDGSSRVQLTNTETLKVAASWSPGGQFIAYGAITRDGFLNNINNSIQVLSIDGSEQRTVIENLGIYGLSIVWANDNRHLAFIERVSESGKFDLYIVDICTGVSSRIIENISNVIPDFKP